MQTWSLRVMVNFQEKKKLRQLFWIFSFRKIFLTEKKQFRCESLWGCSLMGEHQFGSRIMKVVRVWAEVVRGWKSPCIKISYSEPTGADSREGTSRRRELSGDVMTTRCAILVGWRLGWRNSQFWLAAVWLPSRFNVLRYGSESMY